MLSFYKKRVTTFKKNLDCTLSTVLIFGLNHCMEVSFTLVGWFLLKLYSLKLFFVFFLTNLIDTVRNFSRLKPDTDPSCATLFSVRVVVVTSSKMPRSEKVTLWRAILCWKTLFKFAFLGVGLIYYKNLVAFFT